MENSKDLSIEEWREKLNECKSVLGKLFLSSRQIPISRENHSNNIDGFVCDYLLKEGHDDWLSYDVSYGAMIGGFSERELYDFLKEGRVFDNPHLGSYRIEAFYGPMSGRSFRAVCAF